MLRPLELDRGLAQPAVREDRGSTPLKRPRDDVPLEVEEVHTELAVRHRRRWHLNGLAR